MPTGQRAAPARAWGWRTYGSGFVRCSPPTPQYTGTSATAAGASRWRCLPSVPSARSHELDKMPEEQSLRVVIVDDEPLARAVIREYLKAHPDVEVVAECGNGFEAVKEVSDLSPDLMFLDVQMPKLD